MEEPLSSSSSSRASYSGWQPFHAKGTAIFDLKADTERTGALYQVSFHLGDIILIQESCEGWYKGILARTGERGLFPENYVYVRITRETDRVKRELDTVLHEWTALLQRFYTQKQLTEFNVLKTRLKVLKIHNQILKSPDTGNLSAVKRTVMNSIEEGRRIMGLDVVVKGADDNVATEFNTPPFQLCKMHIDLADRSYYSEVFDPQKASSDASKANAAGAAKQAAAAPPTHHILMDLVVFQCKVSHVSLLVAKVSPLLSLSSVSSMINQIPEPTELFFSIWDNRKKRFITEDYHVKLTTQGMPAEYNKIGKLKTIFKNINEKDITNDLFLVCRLVRTGKMLLVDNGAKTKPSKILKNKAIDYRRPFACGVLSLSYEQFVPEKKRFTGGFNIKQAALDNQDIIEHQMSVFTTSQETNFATLHQMIITNNNITPLPQSLGIKIGLCLLRGDDSDAAVTEHMQELEKDGISFTKKLAVDLGENRNEMYVTLDSTEVSQDRKRSAKNVEIIMSIRDSKGNILPDGICRGAGDPPASTYQSIVFYHTNTPKWDETVPILIPPTDITNYHLYFEIRHCSTKNSKKERSTFAFTFIRLTDEFGTVLADGEHVLPTFKPMKGDAPPTLYLTDSSKVQQRKGEMLKVNTLLCSTQISQNAGMLGLLNWNSHRHELANILNRFTFVSQTELMKFLPDIFEAMLAIWTQMEGTHELSKLVYDALVSVLGLFVDEKASIFTNFRPILAGIIERHVNIARGQNNPIDEEEAKNDKQRLINFANAHKHILTCIQQYFTQLETQPNSKITPTLKALEYSMKLLIASRQLYEQTNSSKSSSTRGTFKQQLLEFFNNFNSLMKKEDPGLIGAQTLALKNFWYWFQDMNQIFAADEMSEIAASFLANLPSSDKKKLTTTKLSVIKELITSNIFGSHREKLVSRCATEVRKVMRTTPLEERDNCIDALLTILDAISTKKKGTNVEAKHLLPLLSDLMGTFEGQKRKQIEGQLFTAIAFLSILSQATEPDFIAFINTFSHTEAKKTYLIKLLSTMQDLIPDHLSCSIIPQTWQAICLFQYSTIRQVITYVTNFLKHNVDEMSKKGYEAVIKPQMEEDNHHLEGYAKLSTHKQAYLLKKAGANKRLLPKREWAIGFGNADADNHSGVTTGGDHSMGGGATGGGIGAADMEKKKSTVPSRLPAGASSTVTLLAGQGSSSALASSSIITPVSETNSFIAGQNKHSGDNKTPNLKYTPSTAALLGLNATALPKKKGFFDARGRSMSQFHAYSRWEVYIRLFKIMTAFVTTRSLALEKFSESKRKFILEKYGDLRLEVAALMKEGWDEMGDFQAELISSF
ncbi:Dedicator of cytokinesis protein 3, partial [Balamuthia mandrillaris]